MYSVTQAVIEWLTALGCSACSYPTKELAPPFVTVERTGGYVEDMVDHPTIAVQAWASTEAEAEQAATEIRDEAVTGTLPEGVHRMAVNAGPYPFWDEDTRFPRYQVVFDATCQLTE